MAESLMIRPIHLNALKEMSGRKAQTMIQQGKSAEVPVQQIAAPIPHREEQRF
jgi:hypothetical protein